MSDYDEMDFDTEAPNCTNCGTPMRLNDGCEWPDEPELCVCDSCAHTLYEAYWHAEQEIEQLAASIDPLKKSKALRGGKAE